MQNLYELSMLLCSYTTKPLVGDGLLWHCFKLLHHWLEPRDVEQQLLLQEITAKQKIKKAVEVMVCISTVMLLGASVTVVVVCIV